MIVATAPVVQVQQQNQSSSEKHEYVTKEIGCFCIPMRSQKLALQSGAARIDSKQGGCNGRLPLFCCSETKATIIPYSAVEVVNSSYGGCYDSCCCSAMNKVTVTTSNFNTSVNIGGKEGTKDALITIQDMMSK